MRFCFVFLYLALSACAGGFQDQEAENGRLCYSDFGFSVNSPEFAECKMWRARLVELHRQSIFDRDESFEEFACQDILDQEQKDVCLKQKRQAFLNATAIAAQVRASQPAVSPSPIAWEPDCRASGMQAAGAGRDSYQAEMDCLMAKQMRNQLNTQQQQPQSITSDPQFCMGLAMMRGSDPLQAQMDCAMTNAITANPGNPAIQQQYHQYQQQRAFRQQQEQMKKMQEDVNYLRQQESHRSHDEHMRKYYPGR